MDIQILINIDNRYNVLKKVLYSDSFGITRKENNRLNPNYVEL